MLLENFDPGPAGAAITGLAGLFCFAVVGLWIWYATPIVCRFILDCILSRDRQQQSDIDRSMDGRLFSRTFIDENADNK